MRLPAEGSVPMAAPLDYQSTEIESTERPCPTCGGAAVRGALSGSGRIRFIADHVRRSFTLGFGPPVSSLACTVCGVVTLTVEPRDVPRLSDLAHPNATWRRIGRAVGRIRRMLGAR